MHKYRYRLDGSSGRGEGRKRYRADDTQTFRYLGTIEGVSGAWRVDGEDDFEEFRTRDAAADEVVRRASK